MEKEKYGYIYLTTNLINGKIYVGQHAFKSTRCNYKGSGKKILRAFKKYGKENFKKEILEYCDSFEELNEREKYWIKKYNARNRKVGYNITDGGQGTPGLKHSEEAKKKISEHNSRYWKGKQLHPNTIRAHRAYIKEHPPRLGTHVSEETKEKLRQANLGKTSPMKGKKHSEETRKKLRESHLGNSSHTGIAVDQKTKEKIGNTLSLYNSQLTYENGRFSEETRKKLSENSKGRIYINNGQITKNVKKEELDNYISEGWRIGRYKEPNFTPKRIRINNGTITKNIVAKYLNFYLENGWSKGSLKKLKDGDK